MVVVVGAGITGLACAWRLNRLGLESLVLESADRPGGVIRSERIGDYLIEHGPNTFLPVPENFDLLDTAGLTPDIVEGEPGSPRYVCIGHRLRRIPLEPMTFSGLIRAAAEPFVRSKSAGDESIHDFFVRRFGRQTEQRLVSPFVTGIYAGNTRDLSMAAAFPKLVELERKHGSLILGMVRSRKPKGSRTGHTCSFRDGMETLPLRLAAECKVELNARTIELGKNLSVRWSGGSLQAAALVLTVPAYRAREIVGRELPQLAEPLGRVDYAPMVVATTSVAAAAFPQPLRGFGFLVPRSEKLHLLGTLFSSVLFPGRAPAGRQLLTSFVGGALERDVIEWSDERIWNTVVSEVASVLKTTAPPKPLKLLRWNRALPQYRIGHSEITAAVKKETRAVPGLFLAGNYLDGVSVAACLEAGERTAREVAAYLRKQP
jgi:protoporphyrinogen/coproporphyrinogen III oxidase